MRLPLPPLAPPPSLLSRLAAHGTACALSLLLVAAPPIFPALAAELSPEQKLVASAWKKVDQEYVDRTFAGQDWFTVRQKLVKQNYASRDAAYDEIRGMLGKLGDKYTRFLTPAMYDAVFSVATGDVAGIGVELEALGGDPFAKGGGTGVAIATVVEGGPADKAGLKPGDVLQSVDGDDVGAKTPEEAAAGVRGAPGSRVRLAVRRDGADEVLVIERGAVKLAAVTTKVAKAAKGETVGVIRIRQFSTSTAADVKKALEELTPKVGRLVLDLRGNTGGYFPGGVDVARLLLPNDATITVVTDYKLNEVKYTTFDDGVELEKPVVALVDGRTASASEILTSALQDNARATVVGGDEKGRTFGKAVIQNVAPLDDGSAVVVTTARYQTPKRADINGRGIQVDVAKACPLPTAAEECI